MSVLVVAEIFGGSVKKSTYAALQAARIIGERKGLDINIVAMGSGLDEAAQELATYGAENVYVVDDGSLANYMVLPFAAALTAVVKEAEATWILAPATTTAKDLMPRVAARLGAGYASDVIRIDGDGDAVKPIRPMWAGNVLAEVEILTDIKVMTIRSSDWDAAEATGGESEIEVVDDAVEAAQEAPGIMRFVKFDAAGGDRPELTEANVVIAGGRGLKDKARFDEIAGGLADLFGAAVGATRAAVDAGFCSNDLQVGQTGKAIAPSLYIGVAISGAIQHLAGMKNSKVIVAINKDAEAPIFQVSDYGLVADAFKAVPELAEGIEAIRG